MESFGIVWLPKIWIYGTLIKLLESLEIFKMILEFYGILWNFLESLGQPKTWVYGIFWVSLWNPLVRIRLKELESFGIKILVFLFLIEELNLCLFKYLQNNIWFQFWSFNILVHCLLELAKNMTIFQIGLFFLSKI